VISLAIEDACRDVASMKEDSPGKRQAKRVAEAQRADAINWIFSDSQEKMSFLHVCGLLGFDHDIVRGRVKKSPREVYERMKRAEKKGC